MIKKVLISILFLTPLLLEGQVLVREKSSLDKIDQIQTETNDQYFSKYINSKELTFVENNWLYALSYEPDNNGTRNAYLYKRELNSIGNWVRVSKNPVLNHFHNNSNTVYYDNQQTNSGGTSSVETINTKEGDCIIMFVSIIFEYNNSRDYFTEFIVFYPISENNDSSVNYGHITKSYDFRYFTKTGRKTINNKNLFHNNNKTRWLYVDYKSYDNGYRKQPFLIMYNNELEPTGFYYGPIELINKYM